MVPVGSSRLEDRVGDGGELGDLLGRQRVDDVRRTVATWPGAVARTLAQPAR